MNGAVTSQTAELVNLAKTRLKLSGAAEERTVEPRKSPTDSSVAESLALARVANEIVQGLPESFSLQEGGQWRSNADSRPRPLVLSARQVRDVSLPLEVRFHLLASNA